MGFVVSVLFALNVTDALGEHEADHRYVINGYVLNEDRSPVAPTTVIVNADGTGGRDTTDSDGYYSVRLHLHDVDLGREIRIKTEYGEGVVRARFDPGDDTTARVHRVDFVGGKLLEEDADSGGKVPAWLLYLFGLSVLVIAATALGRPIRKLKKALAGPKNATSRVRSGSSKARTKRKKSRRNRK